jgi:hypothetical protein
MLPATQCYGARGDTRNENMPFDLSLGEAEIERQNAYGLFIYGDIHYTANSFCKIVLKNSDTIVHTVNSSYILQNIFFVLLSVYYFIAHIVQNNLHYNYICIYTG